MTGTELRQIRLEAIEGVDGWHLRLVLTRHDEEGSYSEPEVFVSDGDLPLMASSLDQAWIVLVTVLHLLEEAGGMGDIRGMRLRR